MELLYYIVPTIIVLGIMAIPHPVTRSHRLLNTMTVVHAGIYFAVTAVILINSRLPLYYFAERYWFIDIFGVYEVLIASLIFIAAAFFARGYIKSLLHTHEIDRETLKLFYGGFNLLLALITFAFFANNLALFWILLELTTVISAVLIVTLNAKENILAALKYIFIASTAMLFSFIGIILVFAISRQSLGAGTLNWSDLIVQAKLMPPALFTLAFMLMLIGFGAKSGIVPFHTWLPPAHAKAPSVVSALLSAALLNAGIYGIIRIYAIAHQTEAIKNISFLLIVFGVVTIAVASFSMLARENIKKLIAFSSIEHMGLMLVGIGLGTPVAIFWVLFHTLGHALIKSLLFFSSGVLHQQFASNKHYDMKNVLSLQPLASAGLIIGAAAIIGTPMFPLFSSKLFILTELGKFSLPLLFVVLCLLLLVGSAFVVFLIKVFTNTDSEKHANRFVSPWSINLSIGCLLLAITALGVYFPPFLGGILNQIVSTLGL